MYHLVLTLLLTITLSLSPPTAYAADDTPPKQEQEQTQGEVALDEEKFEQAKENANEVALAKQAAYEKMTALRKNLEPRDQDHFTLLYSNHNLIETVKVVKTDVKNAINGCQKNNPDMKNDLSTRYKKWDGTIAPLIEEAQGHLSNMIIAQDYAAESDVREILDALDTSRKKAGDQITKIPVTTKEACAFLLEKMDETQQSMGALLRSTLISLPQVFPDEEEAADSEQETSAPEAKHSSEE